MYVCTKSVLIIDSCSGGDRICGGGGKFDNMFYYCLYFGCLSGGIPQEIAGNNTEQNDDCHLLIFYVSYDR